MLDRGITTARPGERVRVLMLAYACSPYRGSEPGTGWQRARENARFFDTWVICEQGEFEEDIRRYENENGRVPGLSFCFVPKTRTEIFVGSIPGLYYMTYRSWHRRAYRAAVELHERHRFNLVHQANMCGFREPGFLWKLPPPFVWGPIGGSQNYPWRFLGQAGVSGAAREFLRSIANRIQLHFSPTVRKAAKKAAVVLAANSENQGDFERVHGISPELFLEIGVKSVKREVPERERGDQLRLLWSGQYKHHKALQLLIAALAQMPDSVSFELRILGEGPLEARWRRMIRKHGIESHCRWMGWLPLREAYAQYDWADLFVFTSLRDTAGTVVLEALSRGVPVVCLDHQGAGDIVTRECGVKIPVSNPKKVVTDLTRELVALADDSKRLESLSSGAVLRAEEFLWSHHGKRLAGVYRKVLENQSAVDGFSRKTKAEADCLSGEQRAIGERWS